MARFLATVIAIVGVSTGLNAAQIAEWKQGGIVVFSG